MKALNQDIPLITEWNDSDTLVIAAKGYGNKLGLCVDKFFQKAGLEFTSKIIIGDSTMQKTLGGLAPDFPTFEDLLNHLKELISKHPHKKFYTTGTSGGAHTALLLGHLLKADKVIAFAPYPYLSRNEFVKRNDPANVTMTRAIDQFERLPENVKQYLDLADVLVNWNGKTEYFVHISRYNKWDYIRARYLHGLPHLKVVTHPHHRHSISSVLANNFSLEECFMFPYRKSQVLKRLFLHLKFLTYRYVLMKK